MNRCKVTANPSLLNNGINLDRRWITVVGAATNYLKNFHNGDLVDADIKDLNGKQVVTFLKKVTQNEENVTEVAIGEETIIEGSLPKDTILAEKYTMYNKEKINGAEFGLACKLAVEMLAIRELTAEVFSVRYPELVKQFWEVNKKIKSELEG